MTFERAEYDELVKRKRCDDFERMLPKLEIMRQGAVAGELLTGNSTWDAFLRFVQGAIDTTQEQLDTLQRALASPDLLNQEQLLRTKVDALRCSERIAAWRAVIQLPKDLTEYGEQIDGLIARMEKIGGDDRGT